MTNKEIYEVFAEKFEETMRTGEYATWADLYEAQPFEKPGNSQSFLLCVWGEVDLADNLHFSVSIKKADKTGEAGERMFTTLTKTTDSEELKAAIFSVLQELDKRLGIQDLRQNGSTYEREIGQACIVEKTDTKNQYRIVCESGRVDLLNPKDLHGIEDEAVQVGDVGRLIYFSDEKTYGLLRFEKDPSVQFDYAAAKANYPYGNGWHDEWPMSNAKLIAELTPYIGSPVKACEDIHQFSTGEKVSVRHTPMGIVKGVDDVGVHMHLESNPAGYKDYTIGLENFKRWVDTGVYKVQARPKLDEYIQNAQQKSFADFKPGHSLDARVAALQDCKGYKAFCTDYTRLKNIAGNSSLPGITADTWLEKLSELSDADLHSYVDRYQAGLLDPAHTHDHFVGRGTEKMESAGPER